MKKQKEVDVKWIGPIGDIDQTDDNDLLRLLKHKSIADEFRREDIESTKINFVKALKYLRELFRTYELVSPYHNVGHNFITAVTALRAFIGVIKIGYELKINYL